MSQMLFRYLPDAVYFTFLIILFPLSFLPCLLPSFPSLLFLFLSSFLPLLRFLFPSSASFPLSFLCFVSSFLPLLRFFFLSSSYPIDYCFVDHECTNIQTSNITDLIVSQHYLLSNFLIYSLYSVFYLLFFIFLPIYKIPFSV